MTSRKPVFSGVAAIIAAMAAALLFGSPAPAAPLPGGAGSLVETYQDWVVACQARNNLTACAARQVQSDSQTGQHVLTAEFRNGAGGKLEGALLMPFGLALAQGASLKIDEAAGPALAFSTCLPRGCVIPLSLDAAMTGRLKTAATLHIGAIAAASSQPIALKVSLKGLSAALNRMTELTK